MLISMNKRKVTPGSRSQKKTEASLVCSTAAQYLTFLSASGAGGVETHTINYHLKKVFEDNELQEDSVFRNIRITATDREILQDAGKVTAEIAQAHAENEFEKYHIVQDQLFESDFDKMIKELPEKSNHLP